MAQNSYKKFFQQALLFSTPLLLLVLSYLIFDPFHILYAYKSYPDNLGKSLNRDRISTQMFLNNNPKYHYQSFIFGSSRSSVFYANDWGKYINDTNVFHFDASCETVSAIDAKLKYIDKAENSIKNALFVWDNSIFAYEQDTSGSVFIQDCRVSGVPKWKYHKVFFNAFLSNAFFVRYFDYKLFREFKPYMNGYLENRKIVYTPVHNDFVFQSYIDDIQKDSVKYYSQDYFYERDTIKKVSDAVIKPYQITYLKSIKAMLDKHKTTYQIIWGPMYNQLYINPKDREIIENIFGKDKFHDFAGQNKFTNDKRNYYEIFHYKPQVAQEILREVYLNN